MPVYKGENRYLYGLHDKGGEPLLTPNGVAKGWVLVTEEIRANPNDTGSRDYSDITGKGLGVIVRLNYGYYGVGTIPPLSSTIILRAGQPILYNTHRARISG